MAANDLVTPAKRFIREGDVSYNRINSEAVQSKIASSINYLLDKSVYKENYALEGSLTTRVTRPSQNKVIRIDSQTNILAYNMFIGKLGTSQSNIILNFDVYNSAGTNLGTLFGSSTNRLLCKGNGTNKKAMFFGRDLLSGSTFSHNTSGVTLQYGVLNFTEFNAGDYLIPSVSTASITAVNLYFELTLSRN